MKYLTKEWYYGNKNICLDLEVDTKAEKLSEEYYKELYNSKLNSFLEEEKEVSEMDYEPETWEDIQIMDDEGNIISAREVMSEEEFEALRQQLLEEEQNQQDVEIEPYDEEASTNEFLEMHQDEIEELKENLPKEILDEVDHQENAVVNYTEYEVPYTRIIEHKHFEFDVTSKKTVISKEYSSTWKLGDEPYYPVNNDKNNALYQQYLLEAKKLNNVYFGGRLGQYKYYDMDKVILEALNFLNI